MSRPASARSSELSLDANDWSPKGLKTVEVLQLDRREALAAGYRKTFLRLSALVEQSLTTGAPTAADLMTVLREADDHGLLDWCFLGSGQTVKPFSNLRKNYPQTWAECVAALETSVGR